MWTAKNRGRYDRSKLRYPSDLTDDEWAHVEPLIPPAKRGGNKRHVEVREVMNGINVYFEHRMPVACDPERLAATQHTVRLSRLVELRPRWIASITRFMWSVESKANEKPARPPPSSIAK